MTNSMLAALCVATLGAQATLAQTTVGGTLTTARTPDGQYISWREHIIDEPASAGFELSGSDGLVMADIDNDGYEDIVSVHESDSVHDLEPRSVRKKMKDKGFARSVSREDITQGAEELGVDLNDHIAEVIDAMRGVAGELGLAGE